MTDILNSKAALLAGIIKPDRLSDDQQTATAILPLIIISDELIKLLLKAKSDTSIDPQHRQKIEKTISYLPYLPLPPTCLAQKCLWS